MTNPGAVVVGEASETDRQAVLALTREFATSFAPTPEAFDEAFGRVLGRTDSLLLVAHHSGAGAPELLGYLLAERHPTLFAGGAVAWVDEIMVEETARGAGIGRQLVAAAEDWARAGGAGYVALATRRAGGFYRALGYEESAVFYRKLLED